MDNRRKLSIYLSLKTGEKSHFQWLAGKKEPKTLQNDGRNIEN